jgi:hypothetical protein
MAAQAQERGSRELDSPQNRRVPQQRIAPIIEPLRLPIVQPVPFAPAAHHDPFHGLAPMPPAVNFNGQRYAYLPPALAQQVTAVGLGLPILAPPPAPVNFNRYAHLPLDLVQQLAALPPPVRPLRGRHRQAPLAVPQVSIFFLFCFQ